MEKEVIFYRTRDGREPFAQWFSSLEDKILKSRVLARTERIRQGNYGDHKRFHGIVELRFHVRKGYLVYCG